MSRFFGAALIQIGLLIWLARAIIDALGRRAIVFSGLIGLLIGFVISPHGTTMNDTSSSAPSACGDFGIVMRVAPISASTIQPRHLV